MSNQDNYRTDLNKPYVAPGTTYVRETRTTQPSGGIALIVGGLVVAVGFVLWLVFGGTGPVATTPASETTNVTIQPPAAPADSATDPVADPVVVPEADAPVPPAGGTADPVTPAPADE